MHVILRDYFVQANPRMHDHDNILFPYFIKLCTDLVEFFFLEGDTVSQVLYQAFYLLLISSNVPKPCRCLRRQECSHICQCDS